MLTRFTTRPKAAMPSIAPVSVVVIGPARSRRAFGHPYGLQSDDQGRRVSEHMCCIARKAVVRPSAIQSGFSLPVVLGKA